VSDARVHPTLAGVLDRPELGLDVPPREAAAMLAKLAAAAEVLRARLGPADGSLLTVEQVATRLAVKPSTVRAYAERGSLPCVRVGGRLRFKPSDVGLWTTRRYQAGRRNN
jgi:excisionase family DNA binding protein